MEFKFTSDGKKVVVIGKLNTQETIVQEVFVQGDGSEIPSGEQFVVKSLHDKPSVSWYEKHTKEIEENYERQKARIEQELNNLRKTYDKERVIAKRMIEHFRDISKHPLNDEIFEQLFDLMAGNIKYFVHMGYDYKIEEFKQNILCDYKQDSLRLISIFGDSEGNYHFGRHRYSDSSGFGRRIIPCRTFEEAKKIIEDHMTSKIQEHKKVFIDMVEAKEKYDLSVPTQDQLNDYYQDKIAGNKEYMARKEKELSDIKLEIKKFEEKIK